MTKCLAIAERPNPDGRCRYSGRPGTGDHIRPRPTASKHYVCRGYDASHVSNPRRLLILALGLGVVLRLAHTLTSLGTLDMYIWYRFAGLIESEGLFGAYAATPLVNHPPLAMLVVHGMNHLAASLHLELATVFRVVTGLADLVTALTLLRISGATRGHYTALVFYLSPAAIFVSGFHGNTEPLMIMLLVMAVAAAAAKRPMLAGLLLAASVGIKIIPLFVGPLLLLAFPDLRARLRFLAGCVCGAALIFVPGVVIAGPQHLGAIFGYSGLVRNMWGIPLLRYLADGTSGVPGLLLLLVASVVAIWLGAWRRATGGALSIDCVLGSFGLTYFVVLVLAPGFGIQYLFWTLPFIAYALPRVPALVMHGIASLYIFTLYTWWSQSWPWWFTEQSFSPEANAILGMIGLGAWTALLAAAIIATRQLRRGSCL